MIKKFITISDLRTQVCGYLYGVTSPDQPTIKEIRCIVIPPQAGNNNTVTFPEKLCDADYLKNLEPLGWIHTQSSSKKNIF